MIQINKFLLSYKRLNHKPQVIPQDKVKRKLKLLPS